LSNLYNDTEQWKDAFDALDNYLRLEPDTAWAIRRKAYAYQRLGDWDHANPLYLGAAELGDSYAANAYGWSLYTGQGMTRDLDAAIKWFRVSSNQGDANAKVNLVRALREKSPER
jgi:TPR repeat protein